MIVTLALNSGLWDLFLGKGRAISIKVALETRGCRRVKLKFRPTANDLLLIYRLLKMLLFALEGTVNANNTVSTFHITMAMPALACLTSSRRVSISQLFGHGAFLVHSLRASLTVIWECSFLNLLSIVKAIGLFAGEYQEYIFSLPILLWQIHAVASLIFNR
eukprot:Gb_39346 [translate_table: standard]